MLCLMRIFLLGKIWGCEIDDKTKDIDLQKNYNHKNKNPILIVSNPCSFDGFLLNLFSYKLPKVLNTENCKQSLNNLIAASGMSEQDFYKSKCIDFYKSSGLDIMKLILDIFKK